MKKLKVLFFASLFVLFFYVFMSFGEVTKRAVASGLYICTSVVIPSLFPMICLSLIAQESGILSYIGACCDRFCNEKLYVSGYFVPVFLISLISGYPTGACLCASLYEKGEISLVQRNHFSLVCCSAGPSFINLVVGVNLYHSHTLGQILLISHLVASVLTAALSLFIFSKRKSSASAIKCYFDISDGVVTGVAKGVSSILSICAFTLIFFVVLNLLKELVGEGLLFYWSASVLEVTNAVVLLYEKLPIYLISAIVGFGGFSVILQCYCALKHHRPPLYKFILFRLFHALVSAIICFVLLKLIPVYLPTFSSQNIDMQLTDNNIYFSTSLMFVLLVFLSYFYKQKRKLEYL